MSEDTLTTVVLSDQAASLTATFVPGAGMLCCSLRHHGEELLAQNAGVEAYVKLGKTMGVPLLYPWANRLAGFDYSVAGKTVAVPHDPARVAVDDNGLPIHGVIGGRLRWELARASGPGVGLNPAPDPNPPPDPDPGGQTLSARLNWSESQSELFEVFPFRHDLHYEAHLDDGRLQIAVTVSACGADTVPVAFGFHPYLSPPGAPRERWLVELPAMRHLALDAHQIPTGPDRTLPGRAFELADEEFDDGFDEVCQAARFAVTAGDRRLEIELLEGYPCAQVFAPRSGRFICFEPMTAPANALASGIGLRLLAPGESHRATFSLRFEELPSGSTRPV
jgi:aldose 1-epimerase